MQSPSAEPPVDGAAAARYAGLRWVNDLRPGITRRRSGKGFSYRAATGELIRDEAKRAWIRSLAIPPAWTDVWISPVPHGHILATGRDAKGRKQYRYHPRWREIRDATKYTRMIDFGERLPRIRRAIERDLSLPAMPREKVLAAVVLLLDRTLIRVGNDEYARLNESFGLTTMRNEHATVSGTKIRFTFRGKSGRTHDIGIRDRRLARVVRGAQELPGQELFTYVDPDGEPHDISSDDVNGYLRDVSGGEATAKDFRTWSGTVLAYRALCGLPAAATPTEAHRSVVAAVRDVSGRLGNTPAVCRKSYIHPAVIDAYLDGSLVNRLVAVAEDQVDESPDADPKEEAAVLRLLRRRLAAETATSAA